MTLCDVYCIELHNGCPHVSSVSLRLRTNDTSRKRVENVLHHHAGGIDDELIVQSLANIVEVGVQKPIECVIDGL